MSGPVIHTYRAAETGLYVNSYLVEAESGVVVVDTGLLVSDIEALRARLRALNKPLLAILVTHPHPDHFNGVFGLVQDKEVPVYAASSVARWRRSSENATPASVRIRATAVPSSPVTVTRSWSTDHISSK